MPVVFDEVIGEVVPPVPSSPEDVSAKFPPVALSDRKVQTTLRHLEKRLARLKAD